MSFIKPFSLLYSFKIFVNSLIIELYQNSNTFKLSLVIFFILRNMIHLNRIYFNLVLNQMKKFSIENSVVPRKKIMYCLQWHRVRYRMNVLHFICHMYHGTNMHHTETFCISLRGYEKCPFSILHICVQIFWSNVIELSEAPVNMFNVTVIQNLAKQLIFE